MLVASLVTSLAIVLLLMEVLLPTNVLRPVIAAERLATFLRTAHRQVI